MTSNDKSLPIFTLSSTLIFIVTMTATVGMLWFSFHIQQKALLEISFGGKLAAGVTVLQRNFLFMGGGSGFILLILSLILGRVLCQRYQTYCLLKDKEQGLVSANHELEKSLKNIKVLEGLLPVCAVCKKVRDDKGSWNQIDHYLIEHVNAQITHSICPECSKSLYGDFLDEQEGYNHENS